MLTVDPAARIRISDIKDHEAFRLHLPPGIVFPKPFPLPHISTPIDPSSVPLQLFSILKSIGYLSDKEIYAELQSDSHTMAKQFAHMLSKNIVVQALAWNNAPQDPLPQEFFIMSPHPVTRSYTPKASVSSLGVYSFVETGKWVIDDQYDFEYDPQDFANLPNNIPAIVVSIQSKMNEMGYEWLYPDEMHIFIRNISSDIYFVVNFEFLKKDEVKMSLIPIRVPPNEFSFLIEVFHQILEPIALVE